MNFIETDEACPHAWDEANLRLPPPSGAGVYKDDCAYCCRTSLHGAGIYVCMSCFAGVCEEHLTKHMALHPAHAMYTRFKQLPPKEDPDAVKDVNFLGVAAPPEYDTTVVCAACSVVLPPGVGCTFDSYERIVNATSVGVQDAVNSNHNKNCKTDCQHIATMVQEPNPFTAGAPTGGEPCALCPCTSNNWMCMTCGAIGCPRKEAGGNQHAIFHYMTTGHAVVYKVGTIVDGHGDLYCYACDDSVSDPRFREHMMHFGIDTHTAVKTTKTLGEMEYDLSSQHDFNTITEAGADLVPQYGPGFTGLRNFGNTCYMASVVQCLFSQPVFHRRFGTTGHRDACRKTPYDCHECQLERLCEGMRSGEFALPPPANETSSDGCAALRNGITPRAFKKVFAKGHPSFVTGDQQDASEYMTYLLQEIRRKVCTQNAALADPTQSLDYVVEQRSQCNACRAVKYVYRTENVLQLSIPVAPKDRPVDATTDEQLDAARPKTTLDECVSAYLFPSTVECRCTACGTLSVHHMTQRLASFPDVMVLNPRREYFDKSAMQVKKLDVSIDTPMRLDLQRTHGTGPQPGETIVADTSEVPTTGGGDGGSGSGGAIDEVALATVVSMGIDVNVAEWALRNTQCDVERAIDFVFSHPEGPPPAGSEQASGAAPTPAPIPAGPPTVATDGTGTYELVGMISHMGSSAVTGHYVSHIRDPSSGSWILFNDEKVAQSKATPFHLASIYVYARSNNNN